MKYEFRALADNEMNSTVISRTQNEDGTVTTVEVCTVVKSSSMQEGPRYWVTYISGARHVIPDEMVTVSRHEVSGYAACIQTGARYIYEGDDTLDLEMPGSSVLEFLKMNPTVNLFDRLHGIEIGHDHLPAFIIEDILRRYQETKKETK